MSATVLSSCFPYGAPELIENYQNCLMRGLLIATILHCSALCAYWASVHFVDADPPIVRKRGVPFDPIRLPPSLTHPSAVPAIALPKPFLKPSIGIPVPIPDVEINLAKDFATQQQLSLMTDANLPGEGSSTPIIVPLVLDVSNEVPPERFVPHEQAPMPIKKIDPIYPEIARKANLEGQVWVQIWVDKEGKVRRAELLKSDTELFNQPALEAAVQWLFTPALQQGNPVDVWVTLCFRFKLEAR